MNGLVARWIGADYLLISFHALVWSFIQQSIHPSNNPLIHSSINPFVGRRLEPQQAERVPVDDAFDDFCRHRRQAALREDGVHASDTCERTARGSERKIRTEEHLRL